MKETKVEIRDLTNAHAKNQLINNLDKMDGVKDVTISESGGTVKVTYDSPASVKQIEHCIRGAGNKLK